MTDTGPDRFPRLLTDANIDKCLAHPLARNGEASTCGPLTLRAHYQNASNRELPDDMKLICEAILADVLGFYYSPGHHMLWPCELRPENYPDCGESAMHSCC